MKHIYAVDPTTTTKRNSKKRNRLRWQVNSFELYAISSVDTDTTRSQPVGVIYIKIHKFICLSRANEMNFFFLSSISKTRTDVYSEEEKKNC